MPALFSSLYNNLEMSLDWLARSLITFGIFLALTGGILLLVGRVPFLGHLPGDLFLRRPGFSLYFPLATSIVISLALTVILNVIFRLLGK